MAPNNRRIKVLLSKMGLLDPHDTGVKFVAKMLRDEGMEVIYMGLYNSANSIVASAIQEDADVIGISFHAASYLQHMDDLMQALKESGSNSLVLCGGIINTRDIPELKRLGVAEVFLPGATVGEIVAFVENNISH